MGARSSLRHFTCRSQVAGELGEGSCWRRRKEGRGDDEEVTEGVARQNLFQPVQSRLGDERQLSLVRGVFANTEPDSPDARPSFAIRVQCLGVLGRLLGRSDSGTPEKIDSMRRRWEGRPVRLQTPVHHLILPRRAAGTPSGADHLWKRP